MSLDEFHRIFEKKRIHELHRKAQKEGYSYIQKKESSEDVNVLESINSILQSQTTEENISKCQELAHLHRMIENTKARKRLENWSLRVIGLYLFVVLVVVVSCYLHIPALSWKVWFHVPNAVMITILSTTTVNIIGLGLIVLRGHFLAEEAYRRSKKKDRKNKKIVESKKDVESNTETQNQEDLDAQELNL